jgi:predicted N-acetyltransferase YhbS
LTFALDDPAELQERRSPPRALTRVGAALYGPPLRPAGRAWWAGAAPGADLLATGRAVLDAARADGAGAVTVSGPPGNYRVSGVSPEEVPLRTALQTLGFKLQGVHHDLVVTASAPPTGDVREGLGRCPATFLPWVEAHFGLPWRWEAERAMVHHGLFIEEDEHGWAGFACHSGNNVARGTFGPLGVLPSHRGTGLGARLTRRALAQLHARGFARVTIPWVAPQTVGFYRKVCAVLEVLPREVWTLELDP